MRSFQSRGVAAVLVAVAAGLVSCAGEAQHASGNHPATSAPATPRPSTPPSATSHEAPPGPGAMTIEVAVSNGEVRTDRQLVDVPVGSPVEIVVTSDVADELHVHGYDVKTEVEPGKPARLKLTAAIPGVFEVELEQAKQRLFQLRVR